ncbi:MAG: endopeptidase La [Oscillospiraceae bacterium]|nr:endopeptidase La [Oscillospiraceae bacterium]
MEVESKVIPLIPLRGLTIFPHMVLHFEVGRKKSILALEESMINDQEVLVVGQKSADVESPDLSDLNKIGTVCMIRQILKLPESTIKVLVEGLYRAELLEVDIEEPFIKVKIKVINNETKSKDKNDEALVRNIKKYFKEYIDLTDFVPADILDSLEQVEDYGIFCDTICSCLMLKNEEKQILLGLLDVNKRLEKLLHILKTEVDIVKIELRIGNKIKNKIDKMQKDYYLKEQMKAIQEELGGEDEDKKEINSYKSKIAKLKLEKEVKEKALYELSRLESVGNFSSEGGVIKTYLDWIVSLPWNVETKEVYDLVKVKEKLDHDHYGLDDVKERIIEYLAVRKMSNSLKGPIICLVGPPGVGKTSIAKSIAESINRNFVRISLGGVNDEAEIRGHRKTYVGSMPGRIIYGMKKAKSKNPLFLLDEVDKISSDYRGDPSSALLEILDSEQNHSFRDHYLEVEFDLSKVMFITTANTLHTVPPALLDRMEIIEVPSYTFEEKFNIAKLHLVTKVLKEHSALNSHIKFNDDTLRYVIEYYTREAGVRDLERKLSKLVRSAIKDIVLDIDKEIVIDKEFAIKHLGPEIYLYDKAEMKDLVGVVTGMAWTSYGGDTLPVEAVVMDGDGKLELTGQLGDVMKESARAAYSFIRSNSKNLNISSDFYSTKDIHVHFPEGAIPKDGPSAGVALVSAMVSALSNKKAKSNVAMTGEITLTGKVLEIGGLKEKIMAAYRAGINTIIFPKMNEKDLTKIPDEIKDKLKFVPVSMIKEVIDNSIINE